MASYLVLEVSRLFPPILRAAVFPSLLVVPFATALGAVMVQEKTDRWLAAVNALFGGVLGFVVGSTYGKDLSSLVFGPMEGNIRIDLLLWFCIPTGSLGSLLAVTAVGLKRLLMRGPGTRSSQLTNEPSGAAGNSSTNAVTEKTPTTPK